MRRYNGPRWFPKTLFGRTLLFIALIVASGAAALALIARYYAGVASERAYDQLLAGATIQVAEDHSARAASSGADRNDHRGSRSSGSAAGSCRYAQRN